MERFITFFALCDDNIRFFANEDLARSLQKFWTSEGHVAGNHGNEGVGRGSDGCVEAAQGPATKLEVRKETQVQKTIVVRTVGRDDKLICNRGEPIDHSLNQRASKKGLERLILSHAGGLSTSLNTNRKHLRYYKG